jgi:hypothetical protein|tara:strand:+ start:369 stop:947 length:579 start_codon:yes stop_codon:yes gene_type:complete
MYFNSFPIIPYDSTGTGQYKDVTNLLRRVAVRTKIRSNAFLFDTYDVKEGETPESIADKLYGDSELHWVIMLVNNITDRYHQWPMSSGQFLDYINDKYKNADGTSNVDGTHHYKVLQSSGDTKTYIEVYDPTLLTDAGAQSDSDAYSSATLVTNRNYEDDRQDEIRKIRLLDPKYVEDFVDEFKSLMKETNI